MDSIIDSKIRILNELKNGTIIRKEVVIFIGTDTGVSRQVFGTLHESNAMGKMKVVGGLSLKMFSQSANVSAFFDQETKKLIGIMTDTQNIFTPSNQITDDKNTMCQEFAQNHPSMFFITAQSNETLVLNWTKDDHTNIYLGRT